MEALSLKVGAGAWKIRKCRSDGDFFGHLHDFVSAAHYQELDVLVLPEHFVLELLGIEPDLAEHKVAEYLVQYADALDEWLVRISGSSGLTIVGGSHFRRRESGRIGNACTTASPDGRLIVNWKNKLTEYERRVWKLEAGTGLKRLQDFRLAPLICYDAEFPEACRNLTEEGVELLLVPAFTETVRGFQRVRWSCQARAVENQIYVAHASLVGALGREPAPTAYGTSAILSPSIEPFPESAVLAETQLNEEGIAVAELDFSELTEARENGDVRNWRDRWPSDWTVS